MSAQEFSDALAIHYNKPLLCIPDKCDGYGEPFNLSYALICRTSGLVTCRHNEVRDAIEDLSALVWSQVKRELYTKDADEQSGTPALIAVWLFVVFGCPRLRHYLIFMLLILTPSLIAIVPPDMYFPLHRKKKKINNLFYDGV